MLYRRNQKVVTVSKSSIKRAFGYFRFTCNFAQRYSLHTVPAVLAKGYFKNMAAQLCRDFPAGPASFAGAAVRNSQIFFVMFN
ncbi:hypothetical protein D3C84_903150 [compost metagenome]